MSEYKIDQNRGIPPRTTGVSGHSKYPWAQMRVGDSFFAPLGKNKTPVNPDGAKKRYGYDFTYRTVVEDGVKGTRIWRIK